MTPPPLLTIEQAAAYLSVSKTSLRRWTNQGVLHCVRIGPRGERRFLREDLDRLLLGSAVTADTAAPTAGMPPPAPRSPMEALDEAAGRGVARHVSLHHDGRDELWRLFRPYVAYHLERGLPILFIHEAGARGDVERRLRDEGHDPDALGASGLLKLMVPAEAYLRTGSFHPERMIDFIESALLDWRARGVREGLVSGEMTWCLSGAEGVEGMIPYEARLNELLARYPGVTIVCHYDTRRLDGELALGALCSHPHAQLRDRLVAGYYPMASNQVCGQPT